MKQKLSHFQLARLIFEDLAGFLHTGTVKTRHAQLALFVAANQATAERQLSEFLIGEDTAIADAVAEAWSAIASGCGLIFGAAAVQAATVTLAEWEARERRRPEWLQASMRETLESTTANCTKAPGPDRQNGGPEGSGFLS